MKTKIFLLNLKEEEYAYKQLEVAIQKFEEFVVEKRFFLDHFTLDLDFTWNNINMNTHCCLNLVGLLSNQEVQFFTFLKSSTIPKINNMSLDRENNNVFQNEFEQRRNLSKKESYEMQKMDILSLHLQI
jgi:hypothetical protein